MKIERKNLPNSTISLTIEETAENIAKHKVGVIKYLTKNADIKGFRKWANIPQNVIEKHYWEEQIMNMVVEAAIDELFKKALREEKLVPVAQAEIKEVVSQSPLKFVVEIEILPEVEIDDTYKKISIDKTPVSVSTSEVQAALDDIQTRFTQFQKSDDAKYKTKLGDRVTIDTDGFDEKWVLLEATSMKSYPLVVGSNMLVPGFEEKLVWATLGQDLELDIPFPKDYHNADFAGKKTVFKVKVLAIESAVKPEFTEEFIKQLRGKDLDLAGFKKLVKEEITETKTMNARMVDEEKLINELLKISKVEVGQKLLDANTERVYGEIKENLARDQVKAADYLESLKLTEEQYKKQNVEPTALKRLQGELILSKLREKMKIDISDADMQKEIDKIASRFENPEVLERLKDMYKDGTKQFEELKSRLIFTKIIESFLVEKKK
jgi:trigger factor